MRIVTALVVAGCLSLLSARLVINRGMSSGPELFEISSGHGVHQDDLYVLAVWLVGIIGCIVLAWRSGGPGEG